MDLKNDDGKEDSSAPDQMIRRLLLALQFNVSFTQHHRIKAL